MKNGDQFIVLKYTNGIYDCIQEHLQVLNTSGYCWFGKIGMAPSEKNIRQKMQTNNLKVILYCQGVIHICNLLDVSCERPNEGYPSYYENYFYKRNTYPKIYFKINTLEPLDPDILPNLIISSSKKLMMESVGRSMSSYFYAEYCEDVPKMLSEYKKLDSKSKGINKKRGNNKKTNKNEVSDKNLCVFRIEGKCTNRRCVNYKYNCERPNRCINQKISP